MAKTKKELEQKIGTLLLEKHQQIREFQHELLTLKLKHIKEKEKHLKEKKQLHQKYLIFTLTILFILLPLINLITTFT